MAALGYQEVITYSFVEARWEHELAGNANPIRVLNPIAAPLAVMRSSLLGSLIATLRHNLARKAERVRVFEVGRVFARDASVPAGATAVAGIAQPMKLSGLAYGPVAPTQWGQGERRVDFFDLKGDVEALLAPRTVSCRAADHAAFHPGRSAALWLADRCIGAIGELHPRWRQAYDLPHAPVLFELDLAAVLERDVPSFVPLPRQQAVWRDLAFVVSAGAGHDQLIDALMDDPQGLVRRATLFDLYRPHAAGETAGPGEHSMAVRLELMDDQATLTDERIDRAIESAKTRAHERVGARLRG
jgi:phenylalanyl-tRNA synthetase beta chain